MSQESRQDEWTSLARASSDGVLRVDAAGRVLEVNPAAERLLARPAARLVGRPSDDLLTGTEVSAETVHRGADGSEVLVLRTPAHGVDRLLATQVAEVQRRIGADLHDGVGQLLTGIHFLAQGLASSAPPAHAASARRLAELAGEASRQLKQVARGLSPAEGEPDELVELLRDLAADTRALYHVACSVRIDGTIEIASPHTRTQLYLIAREAISNAVQHGQATHLHLRLARRGDGHELSIHDEGRGFRPDEVRLGLGLRSMQSRARQIGGTLEVVSREPLGTTVCCRW